MDLAKHVYVSKELDPSGKIHWDNIENETWQKLVARQEKVIIDRACDEFMHGLEVINFPKDRAPQLDEVNKVLDRMTGWGVHPVPAIIQPKEFFTLLANKRFPAATFIRRPEDMEYLQEPDIFHELYGHTPLLTNQGYADFMQKFGEIALKAEPKDRRQLFRLFWFTIEFGLVKTSKGLRCYGGGILSSIGETQYALTDKSEKVPFDALEALRTPYRIDIMQPMYFVLQDMKDLFSILDQDVLALLQEAKKLGDFAPKYPPVQKSTEKDCEKELPC